MSHNHSLKRFNMTEENEAVLFRKNGLSRWLGQNLKICEQFYQKFIFYYKWRYFPYKKFGLIHKWHKRYKLDKVSWSS